MVEGLNAAFWVSVNTTGALVPAGVSTTTLPVAAPPGTVVTMKVPVQSLGLAAGVAPGSHSSPARGAAVQGHPQGGARVPATDVSQVTRRSTAAPGEAAEVEPVTG